MKTCSVKDCSSTSSSKGLCNKHYLRFKKTGSTDPSNHSHATTEERFWRRVEKTKTCWLWVGGKSSNGYGLIQMGGKGSKHVPTHRYSYLLHKGEIPHGMVVMHSCDVRSCVNPDHLSVGTQKDNVADMDRKGRCDRVRKTGVLNGKSKLNEKLVKMIRKSKKTNAELARELELSPNCIRSVRTGRTWSHITL